MGDEGLEGFPHAKGKTTLPDSRAAYALQLAAEDDRFAAILEAWPTLPDGVRTAMLALVNNPVLPAG